MTVGILFDYWDLKIFEYKIFEYIVSNLAYSASLLSGEHKYYHTVSFHQFGFDFDWNATILERCGN